LLFSADLFGRSAAGQYVPYEMNFLIASISKNQSQAIDVG
jgi:hypothetical protein